MPRAVLVFSKNDDEHHGEENTLCSENTIFHYQRINLEIYTMYNNKVWYQENIKQKIKCTEAVLLLSQ